MLWCNCKPTYIWLSQVACCVIYAKKHFVIIRGGPLCLFRCPLSRIIAPGRPKRLMAGWKFHLAQLTKSFPTDFNYLGPRWNGPLLGAGVNATKYQKPWPRTDIIVRWPHDCLSPIMRWPQERPVQTVWGIGARGGASYFGFPWKIGILSHSGGGVNSFRHCC